MTLLSLLALLVISFFVDLRCLFSADTPYSTTLPDSIMNEFEFQHAGTHYSSDWQSLANSNWSLPSSLNSKYKKYRFNIINYPIIPFYRRSEKHRQAEMITIVTQCSVDRLYMLDIVANHWNGVISLAVYIEYEQMQNGKHVQTKRAIDTFWSKVEQESSAILDLHLVFETERLQNASAYSRCNYHHRVMYPVNHLRNVALQCAHTDYVLLSDADFVPSLNFIALLQSNLQYIKQRIAEQDNFLLVIPAFELNLTAEMEYKYEIEPGDVDSVIPLRKEQLVQSYLAGKSRPFHFNRCTKCHAGTDYVHWTKARTPFYVNISRLEKYEPYVLMKRVGLPRYDARFRGYGFNKIYHLRTVAKKIANLHWFISPDCYLYHIAHKESKARQMYVEYGMHWSWLKRARELAEQDMQGGTDATGYILH